jgi:hypothetical protein
MLKLLVSEFQFFGDGWKPTIEIEDLVLPSHRARGSSAWLEKNASPTEDVGGPHACFDFLAAIRDPTHEENHAPSEWIGGSFDPVAFCVDDINERLCFIEA